MLLDNENSPIDFSKDIYALPIIKVSANCGLLH